MNSFQTKVEEPTPTPPKVKKPTSKELDELCDYKVGNVLICNDMRRNHHIGGTCGVYPCICPKFVPSGRYFDWSANVKK